MNKWLGSGRLTRDPNVRVLGDGNKIATFSIAVDRRFGKKQEDGRWERETDFFDVVSRGGVADYVDEKLRKGTKVIVEGSVENNNFTSREGVKNYSVRIVARSVERMEEKQGEQAAPQSPAPAPQAENSAPVAAPATGPQAVRKPAPAPQPDAPDGFAFIPDGIEEDLPF